MKTKIFSILFAFALSCLAGTLGEGGTPYSIVLPEKSSETERLIAEELKENILKVTGLAPSIVTKTDGKRISIGKAELPSEESWKISVKDGNVRLLGGGERGVCYAAYEFMERFLDIRWLGVGNTYYPAKGPRSIPDNFEVSGTPAFPLYRMYYFFVTNTNQRMDEYQDFYAHNKTNIYMNSKYGFGQRFGSPGGCHTYLNYTKDFPAEIGWMNNKGERIKVQNTSSGQICYTHPEVRARFKKKLREYIEADRVDAKRKGIPYPLTYDVSMNDCDALCHCPECKAEAEKYGITGLVARFTNDIAASIKDDYPDVFVQMFAYKDTVFTPKGDVKLGDNVMVRLAGMDMEFNGPIKRDVMRPLSAKQNEEYMELVRAWGRVASNLAIWDYWKMYYESFANPFGGILNRGDYVRLYRDCGAKSIFVEAEIDFKKPMAFYELRAYVAMKLFDNPDRNVDEIVDDYMRHAYPRAVAPMKAYLKLLEDGSVSDMKPLARTPVAARRYLNPDFFRKAYALLGDAEQKVVVDCRELPRGLNEIWMEKLVLDLALQRLPRVAEQLSAEFPKEMIDKRILSNYGIFATHYWKDTTKMLADQKEEFELQRNRPPLPEQFRERDVIDMLWYDIKSGVKVEDADAAGGKAYQVTTSHFNGTLEEFHSFDFEFGVYSFLNKSSVIRKTIPKNTLPQDEKYHFYNLGKAKIGELNTLWIHHTWWMSVKLDNVYDVLNPDMVYDIYVSAKFQGPSYVKGSTSKDALRVDRIIFVRNP